MQMTEVMVASQRDTPKRLRHAEIDDVHPRHIAVKIRVFPVICVNRQRRRNGVKCLRIEISNWAATLDAFVIAGVLGEQQRNDPAAIETAIARLCRAGFHAIEAEPETTR
jgi:hypothetical protein